MFGKALSSNACRSCGDTSDIVPLSTSQHLYLKPIARMNISVQLPQMKAPGKSISSWEVMERLKKMAKPEKFSILKVTKSTLEFIRFEGEIDCKTKLKSVVDRLDMMTIKLSGFPDALKVRAAEAKLPFPTRHVWDSFFREAKNMNEMKPGERPDTIHISNLPCKWFTLPELQEKDPKPSEYIFRKVFESFGEIRYVDVPCIDPYRSRMKNKSGINTFSFDDGVMFEGYVQFKEYVGFLKAMSALKGMHLMYKEKDKVLVASIRVDFDRSKHMTDHAIKKRHVERERLIQQDAELLNKERTFLEAIESKKEQVAKKKEEEEIDALLEEKQKIEQKKKQKLEKIKKAEKQRKKIKKKLAEEEMKLKMAQTKLENVELLGMLLEKAKKKKKKEVKKKKKEKSSEPIGDLVEQVVESVKEEEKDLLANRELELRTRLLLKYKRNLGTSVEPIQKEESREDSDAENKTEVQQTGPTIPEDLVDKILFSDSEGEFELVDDEEVVKEKSSSEAEVENEACDTEVEAEEVVLEQSTDEDITEAGDSVELTPTEESGSDGEIKSEGEASDSEAAVSVKSHKSEKSEKSVRDSKGMIKKKKHKKDKRKHKEKTTKVKEVSKEKESPKKIGSRVEVVSNHWKSTTRHYTDRDGKRCGDTWIEGKQVYEIGESLPPWPYAPDFYGRGRHPANTDVYDKYFRKFKGRSRSVSRERRSRSRSGDRRRRRSRSVSRDRIRTKRRSPSWRRSRSLSRRRSRSFSRRRNISASKRRSRSTSRRRSVTKWRPRSRSMSRKRSFSRGRKGGRRSRSISRGRRSRDSSSLSLSSSRSRSRSRTPRAVSRSSGDFRSRVKSKSPLRIGIKRDLKKPKKTVSPQKTENASGKERPKPLIMKMPSKRPKKVPKIEEASVEVPIVKEEPTVPAPEVPDPSIIEQTLEADNSAEKSASPTLELHNSPIREMSPIPTDSIPLPQSPSTEVPQSVQEVPIFNAESVNDEPQNEDAPADEC